MRFLLLFNILFLQCFLSKASELDSLLTKLDATMLEREAFDIVRTTRINDLKKRNNKPNISEEQRYYLQEQLIEEYEPFNFDSTQYYIQTNLLLAKKIGNKIFTNRSTLKMAQILASSGRYFEAIEYLNTIDNQELELKQLISYYTDLIKIYTDLGFYSPIPDNFEIYSGIAECYADTLQLLLDKDSEAYLAIEEKKFRDKWLFEECRQINNRRLAMVEPGSRQFSTITFERSLINDLEKNAEKRKKYLIMSAISDMEAAVKDNASLTTLALLLHKEGDINRAYRYIKFAYEDASFYNSRLRFTLISNILPVINEAYQLRVSKQQTKLRYSLYIISFLLFFLLIAIYSIHRQLKSLSRAQAELVNANKKLKDLNNSLKESNNSLNHLNKELSESNHVKEHYIANFLSICSNYIDKLDQYNVGVGKQIKAGKVEELFKQSKSRKLIDQELKEFYQNFDDIFLHIYPHFVEEINLLLDENEQILLKRNESLNTELRVFALIRLGIKDSSRIAKLLRYSVNTIYNYRVRVKNKAKGKRDQFEENIMKIDAVKPE